MNFKIRRTILFIALAPALQPAFAQEYDEVIEEVTVTGSRAFSLCQVEKVFRNVCFRSPRDQNDGDAVERIADLFETSGYRMKTVFAEVAAHCRGN